MNIKKDSFRYLKNFKIYTLVEPPLQSSVWIYDLSQTYGRSYRASFVLGSFRAAFPMLSALLAFSYFGAHNFRILLLDSFAFQDYILQKHFRAPIG